MLVNRIWEDDDSELWGLVHLIDHIQDQAAEQLGEQYVFGIEDGDSEI